MTAAKPSTEDAVIGALESKGGRTAAEIADVAGLGRSTVGKALKRLEESGLDRGWPDHAWRPGATLRAARARLNEP